MRAKNLNSYYLNDVVVSGQKPENYVAQKRCGIFNAVARNKLTKVKQISRNIMVNLIQLITILVYSYGTTWLSYFSLQNSQICGVYN